MRLSRQKQLGKGIAKAIDKRQDNRTNLVGKRDVQDTFADTLADDLQEHWHGALACGRPHLLADDRVVVAIPDMQQLDQKSLPGCFPPNAGVDVALELL